MDPVAVAKTVQSLPQGKLWLRILLADLRHDEGAALRRDVVGHINTLTDGQKARDREVAGIGIMMYEKSLEACALRAEVPLTFFIAQGLGFITPLDSEPSDALFLEFLRDDLTALCRDRIEEAV